MTLAKSFTIKTFIHLYETTVLVSSMLGLNTKIKKQTNKKPPQIPPPTY